MFVSLFGVFNGCSLGKIQIGKAMSNIYDWEKLTFWKRSEKKISRKFVRGNSLAL